MKHVMIVDDDPDILEGLAFVMGTEYELCLARDGSEALHAILGGFVADAIVLDLMMPVLDGAQLMAELRKRRLEIPILLTSAHMDLADRADDLGATDYIAKPFGFEALRGKLDRLLGRDGSEGFRHAAGDMISDAS